MRTTHWAPAAAIALLALAASASGAAAYSTPELRLRELDVSDQPVGEWRPLPDAQLGSANGYELGVVLEKSGEHVLVEVTSVPAGASAADQREVYPTLCFAQTGTPGAVVDLDQRIRYAGNGSYGVRMTVSDAPDASTGCTTANATSGSGTFAVNAQTTVRRIGPSPLVLNTRAAHPKFAGWAIDPPALAGFPELQCAIDAVQQPDGSITGSVTQTIVADRDHRVSGEPYVASYQELPRPGIWTCVAQQRQGGGLVRPPWSAPTEPELVREVWYGLNDPAIVDGTAPRFAITAKTDAYKAGATVKLRLFRARCHKKPRRVAVARSRVGPTGKVRFGFRLPRLRRREQGAIFALDSNLSGSRLIVPHRRSEPNLLLVRSHGGEQIHGTLSPCG
ncbi:MAG: hypothetical protein QOG63_2438 [Thermoleophilaceae bacterium]|jgi:hypothetical protein|nr:hypothetical protein [Thermoleophilaceae bacterium]